MGISAYQINNVLRVYEKQLRQSMISDRSEITDTDLHEKIGVFAKTRRNTMIDDIASNIIERITQAGSHDKVGKGIFKTPDNEHGKSFAIDDDRHNNLIFKEIDGNGETVNSLSIQDSKFLTSKLKEITKGVEKK